MAVKKRMRKRAPVVVIYSTESCIWCARARRFFEEHKVKFKEIDVGTDIKAAQAMIKKSGQQGVPVIEVGKEIIVGFDEVRLRELLEIVD